MPLLAPKLSLGQGCRRFAAERSQLQCRGALKLEGRRFLVLQRHHGVGL